MVLTDGRVQAAGAGIAPGPRAQLCPPAVAGRGAGVSPGTVITSHHLVG